MLTAYAYAISGATLLCRKFLKPKRLRDPQILVRTYSIWSDQDKLLTHVLRNVMETEIMNITSVARFIPPWRHISRIYLFRIQDTWDICDRPSMVMSLLTVRGECLEAGRHMSQRSDLRQNRHLVLHVRQSVYSPWHWPVRVHWFLTQPPTWIHIPVSRGLFPHSLFCSCVCLFNTIFLFMPSWQDVHNSHSR